MLINALKALALVIALIALPLKAKILYQIDLDESEHHIAKVILKIPSGSKKVNLLMPTWRTGKYKILNQSNGIRHFRVKSAKGDMLEWQRIDKSHWQIDNPTKDKLIVEYQVYANELGSRTRHVDSTHAYLDATAVMMYERDMMDQVHQVKLSVPRKWKSYSGMKSIGSHSFEAKSYHQLASSPIETGISELHEFSAGERQYQLVIWGKGNFNGKKMANDLNHLVNQATTIWTGYPFDKYVFIVHATSGASGATEHINSTVIQRPRDNFAPDKEYLKFLRTASHEFVHTWNVKAYRPENLVPYDYQAENYSPLLWIAEGSTSYFQNRLLLTASLETVKEYLENLSERVHNFKHRPGSKIQSVSNASFEKWISQDGDFANNHSVNIYKEGFMASWLLDFELLEDTNLKKGYKDLHRNLYAKVNPLEGKFKKYLALPYNESMIRSIARDLTGVDYSEWWYKNIDSPLNIDFEDLLGKVGLRFKRLKEEDYIAWTGFSTSSNGGKLVITSVENNSPAWRAGLTINDQLIAIDGVQVTQKNLEKRLAQYQPENKIKVALFRNDQLMSKTIVLGKDSKKPLVIELIETPTDNQKRFFKAWLGVDFPDEIEDED